MEKRIFKCCDCGREFTIEADYFIDGVSGWINGEYGSHKRLVDPSADHRCPECYEKAINKLMLELGIVEKEKNKC